MRWLLAIALTAGAGGGMAQGQEEEPEVSFDERLLARIPNGVQAGLPFFSPNGRSVAYSATVEGRESVFVGENQAMEFDRVGVPHFSADGNVVAYDARKGRELWWKVVEVK